MGRPSKYPAEFRREAARLVLNSDRPLAEIARELVCITRCWAAGSRSNAAPRHKRLIRPIRVPGMVTPVAPDYRLCRVLQYLVSHKPVGWMGQPGVARAQQ